MSKQFTPVAHITDEHINRDSRGAMQLAAPILDGAVAHLAPEARAAAETLVLNVPGATFTFEVDLLGTHRITIHFAGGSIGVDE